MSRHLFIGINQMLMSVVDSRTNYSAVSADACDTCCCETVHMSAGETNIMTLNYAPWAIPFARKGLDCATQFHIEQLKACPPPVGPNLPPVAKFPVTFATPINTTLTDSLGMKIDDPEGVNVIYKMMPFQSTKQGQLTLSSDGAFTYIPKLHFSGYDRFFFTASDGVNAPVVMEAVIAVGNVAPATEANYTPKVSVGPSSIDNRGYTVSFPVAVSPAALPCEIYRLQVKQGALDCDCNCYHHLSCYDIRIGKC